MPEAPPPCPPPHAGEGKMRERSPASGGGEKLTRLTSEHES
jgi:hypothetical protein